MLETVEEYAETRFELGGWLVEPQLNKITRNGEARQLEPKVMAVLVVLSRNAGLLTTRAALLEEVWGNAYLGEDPTTRAVSELRKALGDEPKTPRFIETIHGKGYRLVAEVRREAGAAGSSARPRLGLQAGLVLAAMAAAVGFVWLERSPTPDLGEVRQLPVTSFPGREHHPALSPDGSRVAFAWSGGTRGPLDIYVKQRNSENLLRLTSTPEWEGVPVWSGDGTEVAFARMGRTGARVVSVPAIGGPERVLYECGEDFNGFDWSPDGNRLVLAERRAGDPTAVVYLYDLRNGRSQRLTDLASAQMEDTAPLFSADGRRLAFRRKLGDAEYEMFVADIYSGEIRQLTFDSEDNGGFAWSPDGEHLVVSSNRSGTFGLWRVSVGGGESNWLGIDNAFLPSIARDTGDLVFERRSDDIDLWKVPNPFHSQPGEAARWASSTFYDLDPQYSPDGRNVAFVSSRSGSFELWLAESDGTELRQLTFFSKPKPGWSPAVQHPRWSPDGKSLVFSARAEDDFDVFTLGVDGGVPRPLTSSLADETSPVWMHDGEWIFFVGKQEGRGRLWRVRPDGTELEEVPTEGAVDTIDSQDGRTLLLASDYRLESLDSLTLERATLVESMSSTSWGLGRNAVYSFADGAFVRISLADGVGERKDLVPAGTPAAGVHIATSSLSLSPDEAWILYAGISQSESDVMIAENLF
ncbi:MAG: winged helix-turn-helix domain-containing protein [Thermoanaerobaculia bacterium]